MAQHKDHRDLDALVAHVEEIARAIESSGDWPRSADDALESAFAQAKARAIRQAAFLERSVFMRSIARRLIPQCLRPALRRSLGLARQLRRSVRTPARSKV